jgi:hypothetical protein
MIGDVREHITQIRFGIYVIELGGAVCDKASKEKDDRYQPFAAKVSAKTIKHIVSKYGVELLQCYEH